MSQEGSTRIVVDGSGSGTAFIQFVGSPESGGRKDTRLAGIAAGATAGSKRLPVEDAESIKDGQRVRIFAAGSPELRMTAK